MDSELLLRASMGKRSARQIGRPLSDGQIHTLDGGCFGRLHHNPRTSRPGRTIDV